MGITVLLTLLPVLDLPSIPVTVLWPPVCASQSLPLPHPAPQVPLLWQEVLVLFRGFFFPLKHSELWTLTF